MNRLRLWSALPLLLVSLAVAPATSFAQPGRSDKDLIEEVSKRLLAVCDPVQGLEWPPVFGIDEESKGISAYAGVLLKVGKKLKPIVRITPKMMKEIINRDRDRLAYVLGHELGHILLRHVPPNTTALRQTGL
jgi:Zn-dependent protease with chaperone function